jgi:hypothetical protein
MTVAAQEWLDLIEREYLRDSSQMGAPRSSS